MKAMSTAVIQGGICGWLSVEMKRKTFDFFKAFRKVFPASGDKLKKQNNKGSFCDLGYIKGELFMHPKKALFIIVAVSIIFGFLPDKTLAKGVTAGVKIGSLGVGSEISYKINSYFNIRTMGGYFRKNKSITSSDVNYDFTLKLFSAGLMIDLHPFEGSFRISAGVLYNGNKLWGDATPSEGNTTYT